MLNHRTIFTSGITYFQFCPLHPGEESGGADKKKLLKEEERGKRNSCEGRKLGEQTIPKYKVATVLIHSSSRVSLPSVHLGNIKPQQHSLLSYSAEHAELIIYFCV